MSLDLDRSTWTRVAFGDVVESVTERVDDPSAAGVDRYVGLEHLDPGVMTVQRWGHPGEVQAQKLRFRPGDVIFGRRRAYQKKVARADFHGICSAHALVLRARTGRIHPDFLPVFLSSDHFLDRAISISVGSLSPTVNWRDLRVEEFDLPPLDEQKRIADLLWAVERHLTALDGLSTAISLCATPLMTLDVSAWLEVGDVVSVARSGGTPSRANSGFYGGSIGWLKSGEVSGGEIASPGESITEIGMDSSAAWLVPSGATVVAMYGDGKTRGQVGRLAAPMATNQAVLGLVADQKCADPAFLYYWLRSRQVELRMKGAGAAQKNLSKALVISEPFPLVPLDHQVTKADEVSHLDHSAHDATAEREALAAVKSALLAEVFERP